MEELMMETPLETLEKRIAALEKAMVEMTKPRADAVEWKDWRLAVGTVKRTELAEEIDKLGREYREEDRRRAALE